MPGTIEEETERLANAVEALAPLIAAGNAQMEAIKTAIDTITVNTAVSINDLAIASSPRQPQVEAQAIKQSVTGRSQLSKSPKIIR